jgi:hypothetical protein
MIASLKRIGHYPKKRGGNGKPLPSTHLQILEWFPHLKKEFSVFIGTKVDGRKWFIKADCADPQKKSIIEVDGPSHRGQRKMKDERRDQMCSIQGWLVLRIRNQEVLLNPNETREKIEKFLL